MPADVSAPLPDLTLLPGYTITVTDANGVATVSQLVVKVFQVVPTEGTGSNPLLRKQT